MSSYHNLALRPLQEQEREGQEQEQEQKQDSRAELIRGILLVNYLFTVQNLNEKSEIEIDIFLHC